MGRAPAQVAFLYYRNMGSRRSLAKMAEIYQKDRGTFTGRRRSFERWSTRYGWAEKAKAWDARLAEHEHDRKRQAAERMNDDQAESASALWQAMCDCVYELLRLDRLDRHAHETALADWHTLVPETRAKQQPPRPPHERVSAYAAALLMRLGLEYERLARDSALAAIEAAAARAFALPPVFEVTLTDQRPADPADPSEAD